jgi:hypothetical protein
MVYDKLQLLQRLAPNTVRAFIIRMESKRSPPGYGGEQHVRENYSSATSANFLVLTHPSRFPEIVGTR